MQLYNVSISPYASRCRIQIFHKNLPVEIVPPPGGLGSPELKARNPTGKIPVLVLGADGGSKALAESWAIMEYLEACFPAPAMRPDVAFDIARMQELVRFTDLALASSMFPMFRALRGVAGPDAVTEALAGLKTQLLILEHLLARKARPLELDLADAALLPVLWYGRILAAHFGNIDCMEGLPATQDWWWRIGAVPAVARVLAEMEQGLRVAIPVLLPKS